MHTTALTALAIVAIASPALAAPLHTAAFARNNAPASGPSDEDGSGALSLRTRGHIEHIAHFPPFIGLGPELSAPEKRDLPDLAAHEEDEESDAFSLSKLGHVATIAGAGAPIIGGIIDHFSHHDQQQQPPAPQRRRVKGSAPHFGRPKTGIGRWLPPIGRRDLSELAARDDDDESGAFSLKNLGHAATIAGAGAPIIGAIVDHFSHHDQPPAPAPAPAPQRRSSRDPPPPRPIAQAIGALVPGVHIAESAVAAGKSAAPKIKSGGRHGKPKRELRERDVLELLARADEVGESGALGLPGPLGLIGDAVKVGSGIASAIKHHKHHKHKKPKARDLVAELLVRSLEELD
ncbi:hypothetical protein PsYK624_078940 [Phanerochaete sordida]|uniref:Uncharacterized protein n=1 Tax=Phanerochaete sordida TaxID=48140 RepID=A0A9P3G9A1_9APHY|nr:hypothetical protein PsYK624_078940 [Phanerochaete sordida]